jgi:8-oxo-dGTP diphosphatase
MTDNFHGVKIALLRADEILTYLRDDKPTIPWPAHWDLPGGGREGNETPNDCIIREIAEEFDFELNASQIIFTRSYPALRDGIAPSVFMVGHVTASQIASINFGSEGQKWQMMKVAAFLEHPGAVESLKSRLSDYLQNGHLSPPGRRES